MKIEVEYKILVAVDREEGQFVSSDYTFPLIKEEYDKDREYIDALCVAEAMNDLSREYNRFVDLIRAEVWDENGFLANRTEYIKSILIKHDGGEAK